jgi:hypothetical protein
LLLTWYLCIAYHNPYDHCYDLLLLQVIDAKAGTLENVVDLGVTKVRAQATCKAISDVRTDVAINGAGLYTGPLKVPLGVQVRWLLNFNSLIHDQ